MSEIRIVLVDTSHPGNIGASARAMKNMGLQSLVLVRPHGHEDPSAAARATAADDLLAAARVVATVEEAIDGCGLVLGATARPRNAHFRMHDAREAAAEVVAAAASRPAAVLFGGERNGLANAELARCHALIRIPAAGEYESLNLAQAVQVVCYEIRMAVLAGGEDTDDAAPAIATPKDLEALHAHLGRVMRMTGFMHDANAAQLTARLERLFARARPDDGEVRILRGALAAIERGLGAPGRER
jgi:tRNA (cytidine32/uridine32-2'-O)-methyltransferase